MIPESAPVFLASNVKLSPFFTAYFRPLVSAVTAAVAVIVIVGMVSLINMFLGFAGLSLEMIFGYIFAPIGFLWALMELQPCRKACCWGRKWY